MTGDELIAKLEGSFTDTTKLVIVDLNGRFTEVIDVEEHSECIVIKLSPFLD